MAAAGAGIALAVWVASGVVLCESTIRVPRKPVRMVTITGARRSDVQITAADGAVLHGWLFIPGNASGDCVIALHGISDTRNGVMGLARFLVENHYMVLVPGHRGHGESGGELVTYGLREADDVQRWVSWLIASQRPGHIFGIGESLGASVLLQSLAHEHRFSAIVAECPFANLQRVAVDRVAQRIPLPAGVGHVLAFPIVYSSFLFARLKYHLDFRAASPEQAVDAITTPVLLIHGLDDTNIYPSHSRTLAARNPHCMTLWLVPGARHTAALGTATEEFRSRVLRWFS